MSIQNRKMRIVGSIVTYQNPPEMVEKAIDSFLDGSNKREIVLVDHSPSDTLRILQRENVHYVHNPQNPGFGAGHNLAFAKMNEPEVFFLINPDIEITEGTVDRLVDRIQRDPRIGIITCKILNPDGSIQLLLKNEPTLAALVARRIRVLEKIPYFRRAVENFIRSEDVYGSETDVPIASGCFMGVRGKTFGKLGGFDERYFLYFEDFDLCRRTRKLGLQVFYTTEGSAIHLWTRGAHNSTKHLLYFLRSLIQYFFGREKKVG